MDERRAREKNIFDQGPEKKERGKKKIDDNRGGRRLQSGGAA